VNEITKWSKEVKKHFGTYNSKTYWSTGNPELDTALENLLFAIDATEQGNSKEIVNSAGREAGPERE
jgi:hypothetical protein